MSMDSATIYSALLRRDRYADTESRIELALIGVRRLAAGSGSSISEDGIFPFERCCRTSAGRRKSSPKEGAVNGRMS